MRAVLAAAALVAAANAVAAEPPKNAALHAFFEREFRQGLEEAPENATFLGVPGYNDRLSDNSPEATERRRARVKSSIRELERFDPRSLNTQDRLSREVMLHDLRREDAINAIFGPLPFASGGDGYLPVSPMWGPHQTWSILAKSTRFESVRDYEDYLKRLQAMPRYLEQLQARMRIGMRWGWVAPRAAMESVPARLDPFAGEDVTSSTMWSPFKSFPESVPAAERERLATAGRAALVHVHAAFARLRAFLREEYLPAGRRELGASTLPGGMPYYAQLAASSTTTAQTPEEIHDVGLKEVARIRRQMDETMRAAGFTGTFAEFIAFLRSDPRFVFKTPEDRLRAYRDIAKRADAELPKLFAELPRTPYGIRPMEAYEGDNADHYTPPALDGSRAGFFEANVNNLGKRPSYEMEAVLLHEAVPGHHLQIARSYELKDLPRFRRSGFYTAYVEGWALYAESLGYEMGFYTDPYQRFGALQAEALRAVRLVIDTGIHAKGWGREQSIRYLVDNTGSHPDFATAEVDRYIVWPGQALGYKVGQLKIMALREKAKQALGARFDVRRFHNAILDDGALPLAVLEARIDDWIRTERGRKK
jgi:uncharacterized protein (DUF885 family)